MAALALLGAACGGDGNGGGPDNATPAAAFTANCNALACNFTDGSTDADGDADIVSWDWDFGDDGTSDLQDPAHTYAAAGTYTVELTVTDASGATDSFSDDVTVSTTATNQNPSAEFDFACASLSCDFTDASTDPDAGDDVVAWEWTFGDGGTATTQNPTHAYTATVPDTFTVTLTATDSRGGEDAVSHDVIVAPPASCEGASCDLTLQADATVTVTLTSEGCTAGGNTLRILAPVDTTLFTNGCNTPAGTSFNLGGTGNVFTSGTTIVPEVESGSQDLAFTPTLRLRPMTGYPTWVLEFDDGEGCGTSDPTCGGTEPDFDDLVITITATP